MNRKHWSVIIVGVVLFVAALAALADPSYSHTVTTNSVMILPPRNLSNAAAWATNTLYAQGQVVKSAKKLYWCQTAAGATNTIADLPAYEADGRSANGTNTWQFIPSEKRSGCAIVNDGTNTCYISFGSAAVLNSGIRLNANGGNMSDFAGTFQGPVYAISASPITLTAQEW